MPSPFRLAAQAAIVAALGLTLADCTSKPVSEMPAATAAAPEAAAKSDAKPDAKPQAKPAAAAAAESESDKTPMDRAEANAQCWMKYDKASASLEAKAKLVEKCSDEKMKAH